MGRRCSIHDSNDEFLKDFFSAKCNLLAGKSLRGWEKNINQLISFNVRLKLTAEKCRKVTSQKISLFFFWHE
jgi:hypothetical protein